MPHQLEAFKIASNLKLNDKGLVMAMVLAAIVGTIVSIVAHVAFYYKYQFARWGVGEFYRLQNWITHPSGTEIFSLEQMGFGFLLTMWLMVLKRRFLWWPFYPVGYAVGNGWAISWMWFSIFLGWLSKKWLLSFGGIKSYRKAMPLFFGFILGQFLMGSLWSIIGVIFEKQVYTMFP
jgi:hypothetical protein